MKSDSKIVSIAAVWMMMLVGCGSQEKKDRDFFTSGNRDADQRAEQRMAKSDQIQGKGTGEGGENSTNANAKKSLYERLGGDEGIKSIVNDFVDRALADPRVNWQRKGVKRSVFSLRSTRSVEWKPKAEDIDRMKTHIAQFLSLATGGPAKYDGRDLKQGHRGLMITNAEFDASVGDLKATLDKIGIPTPEQKELLSIVESTRPQVAEER